MLITCFHPECDEQLIYENERIKYCPSCRACGIERINKNKKYAYGNSYGNPETKLENDILSIRFCGMWLTDSNYDLHHLNELTKRYTIMRYITSAGVNPESYLSEIEKCIAIPKSIHALLSRIQRKLRVDMTPEYNFESIMTRIKLDYGDRPEFDVQECEQIIRKCIDEIEKSFQVD